MGDHFPQRRMATRTGLGDEETPFKRSDQIMPLVGSVKNFDSAIESLKAIERHEKEKLLQTLVLVALYSFFVFSGGMILLP